MKMKKKDIQNKLKISSQLTYIFWCEIFLVDALQPKKNHYALFIITIIENVDTTKEFAKSFLVKEINNYYVVKFFSII